jgi:hypothetical protein
LDIESQNKGRDLGKRLFSGTSHSDQKGRSRGEIQNSRNSHDVFHSVVKENKVHDLFLFVVLLELFFKGLLEFLLSFDLDVRFVISLMDGDERGKEVEFFVDNVLVLLFNLFCNGIFKVEFELGLIFNGNHSIFEDSSCLGDPKGNEFLGLAFVGSLLGKHDSLAYLREISQVELVMELFGRGGVTGVLEDFVEEMDSSVD